MKKLILALVASFTFVAASYAQQGAISLPLGGGGIPAAGNISLYVASTGSDNNPCSSTAKCLTIQHAVNVAAQYNYQNIYTLQINVSDATYAVNGSQPAVTLLPLVNYPFGSSPTIVGNTTTPANVVVSNTSGDAVATFNRLTSWNMTGFRLKSTSGANCDLNSTGGTVNINDATGNAGTGKIDFAGNYKLMCAVGSGAINAFSQSINISSTSFAYMAYGFAKAFIPLDGSTVTFPGVSTTVSQYVVWLADNAVFGNPTFVNGSNVVGNKFWIGSFSYLEYSGTVASFPGNGSTYVWALAQYWGDNSVRLTDYSGNLWGDYNVTTAGNWTFQNNMELQTTSTTCLEYKFSQSGGGHAIAQQLAGSGGCFGLAAGQNGWLDYSTGSFLVWYGSGAAPSVTFAGVIGITGTTGTYGAGAADVGWSRLGAASLALGNGTASDFTGTLKLATLNPVTSYQLNGVLMVSATAPTISAGFCATTPSISASNGVAAFDINVGTSCSGSVGTLAMPTATTGWVCNFANVTAPASNVVSQTGGANNTVTLTNYARTTGLASNFTASNHIRASCVGY